MNRIQYFIVALILGAFLTQGFQCTSPEMSTARVAKKNNDFEKAITFYEKELTKNPTNSDAMYELAQIYLKDALEGDAAKLVKATELTIKAKETAKPATKPSKTADQNAAIEYSVWAAAFNIGTNMLNTIDPSSPQKDEAGAAMISLFQSCIKINPENPVNYSRLGLAYATIGDKAKAAEAFQTYNKTVSKELEFISSKGMSIGQNPAEVIKILGQPDKNVILRNYLDPRSGAGEQDTLGIMTYKINNEDFFVYTRHNTKTHVTGVCGWLFNPVGFYRGNPFEFDVTPTAELARLKFEAKEYDDAAEQVKLLKAIDPTNVSANQFLIQIFEAQGDPEKAVSTLAQLVKENPTNAAYHAQYGDILVRNKRYDEAVAQYNQALQCYDSYTGIDKDIRINEIKRILGSAYKNQAVEIQKEEFAKLDKDTTYKINESRYLPILNKSKGIFEDLVRKPEFSTNYVILLELADIYFATNEKAKIDDVLNRLVAVRDEVEPEDTEFYLLNMINYFDRTQNTERLNEFNKYYEDFKK